MNPNYYMLDLLSKQIISERHHQATEDRQVRIADQIRKAMRQENKRNAKQNAVRVAPAS